MTTDLLGDELQRVAEGAEHFAPIERGAVLSTCLTYRYRLTRLLGISKRIALFVMLNPSTADARRDDNTIRRCMWFARTWGCGELFVENLFAFRSTDPHELLRQSMYQDVVGPKNNDYIIGAACRAHESGGVVVAAWGAHGGYRARDREVMKLLVDTLGIKVQCLGITAEGFPKHPLYLAKDTALQPYAGRAN